MDLKQLRCFIAVAEELHFGRAAARLHISQPPVTQSIKRLEDELGVQLLVRSKRSVHVTAAGTALLEEARSLVGQADHIKRTVVEAERGNTGVLCAGFFATAVFSAARQHYLRLVTELPGITVNLQEMNTHEQVRALQLQKMDLGVIHSPIEHHGLRSKVLTRERMMVALHTSHPLASAVTVAIRQLAEDHFILPTRYTAPGLYDAIIAACNAAGFSPVIPHQARHMLSIVGLVSINAGIAFVPHWLRTCTFPEVVFVDIEGHCPLAEISIAWNPKNKSPVLDRVISMFDYQQD